MSIQTIIDKAQRILFDRKRIVGQTLSRSQRIKSAERATAQPMKIKVTPPGRLAFDANRSLIESIYTADRVEETEINLANNTNLSFLTEYQGNFTTGQLNAMTITNFTTATMTIGNLPSAGSPAKVGTIGTSTVVFAAGDFIQPELSRYPYIVTQTVLRGSTSTITVNVNRAAITSEATTLTGHVLVGNDVTFKMVCVSLPNYQVVQNNYFEFDGDFELIERIV